MAQRGQVTIAALLALLRRLEWAGWYGTRCVLCHGKRWEGHQPGCEVAAVLERATSEHPC